LSALPLGSIDKTNYPVNRGRVKTLRDDLISAQPTLDIGI
jgi:hypothetical protein